MATIKGPFQIEGSIKGLSFYPSMDGEKTIMRTKGGAKADAIRHSPKFVNLRKHHVEWRGCTQFGSLTRYAFGGLHRLADYNLTPVLNGLAKKLMGQDKAHPEGGRAIELSHYKQALERFQFNRKFPFSGVMKVNVNIQLDRQKLQLVAQIPRINTATDIWNVRGLPFFRLHLAIGAVSDWSIDETTGEYLAAVSDLNGVSELFSTGWYSSNTVVEAQELSVSLPDDDRSLMCDQVTLLGSIAIEFGAIGFLGEPIEVKNGGCGLVMVVG